MVVFSWGVRLGPLQADAPDGKADPLGRAGNILLVLAGPAAPPRRPTDAITTGR